MSEATSHLSELRFLDLPSPKPPELTEGYACDVAFPDRAVPESS